MRYLIILLALAGVIVSALALHVHYYHGVEPCDINAHWDCGIVNHSRYSMIAGVPVAALGIIGYALIGFAAFIRQRPATLVLALIGLGFALYLSNIEAHVLEVWCLYCVISQGIIVLITLAAFVFLFRRPKAV